MAGARGNRRIFDLGKATKAMSNIPLAERLRPKTIDEYNAGVDAKKDKMGKAPRNLTKIDKAPFWAGYSGMSVHHTMGGVRINKYCEVLDKNHMPIEGLYSAGSDANTIYGDSYNFTLPGNSMGFAVNTGRMAGESVADYISEL